LDRGLSFNNRIAFASPSGLATVNPIVALYEWVTDFVVAFRRNNVALHKYATDAKNQGDE
jgi:hypothetical protein